MRTSERPYTQRTLGMCAIEAFIIVLMLIITLMLLWTLRRTLICLRRTTIARLFILTTPFATMSHTTVHMRYLCFPCITRSLPIKPSTTLPYTT